MRLEKFLEINNISMSDFAKMIGKDKSLIYKYIHDNVKPKDKVMAKIYRVTCGSVTANDFYRLSDQIFGFCKESLNDKSFS